MVVALDSSIVAVIYYFSSFLFIKRNNLCSTLLRIAEERLQGKIVLYDIANRFDFFRFNRVILLIVVFETFRMKSPIKNAKHGCC